MPLHLALKVDVDTDRGTRLGVPNLVTDCRAMGAPAVDFWNAPRGAAIDIGAVQGP